MADPVLERYKTALKAGHVAVLRGHHDEAMARYREAAEAAPDRALPYSSLGGVLARLGRFEDARAAYTHALELGAADEGTLRGLAEALAAVGRRPAAAATFDRLADLQAETGRLPEALETLRRADELAADPLRSTRIAELTAKVDGARPRPAAPAGPAATPRPAPRPAPRPRAKPATAPLVPRTQRSAPAKVAPKPVVAKAPTAKPKATAALPVKPTHAPKPARPARPAVQPPAPAVTAKPDVAVRAPRRAPRVVPVAPRTARVVATPPRVKAAAPPAAASAVPAPVEVRAPVIAPPPPMPVAPPQPMPVAPPPPLPDGEPLVEQAEAAAAEGRTDAAQSAYAAAAVAYLAAGQEAAAIDACERGLELGASSPALHLQLTRAYLALGWRSRAVAKLVLLDRLLEIDGDRNWRVAVASLASTRLAGEPELAGIVTGSVDRSPDPA